MTIRDRQWISLRHMRSGLVGVILVILATAIGIALSASTAAFIRSYREQTRELLNHPAYREVLVEVLGVGETEIKTPVVEIEMDKIRSSFMGMDDMREAAESSPAVEYAYVAERDTITTTAALMRLDARKGAAKGAVDAAQAGTDKAAQATKDDRSVVELPVDEFEALSTSSDFFTAYGFATAEGFLFTRDDEDAGNLVMLLGHDLAGKLFPEGGAVGARVSIWYQTVTIVGILESTPYSDPADRMPYDDMAFVPQAGLEQIWNKRLPVTSIRFTTADSADTRAAVSQLTAYFRGAHPDANLMITSSVEELRKERQTLSRVIVVLVFLTAVGLFIAAINLLNLMLMRIIRHTKGIGIMRALGWTGREIFRQFMSESLLMCLAGAVLGVVVSPLVFRLLQGAIAGGAGLTSRTFVLDLLGGGAVGLLFSLAFGVYPAVVAKNTDTTSALRAE